MNKIETKFAQALRSSNIGFISQYRVGKRRLDFALVGREDKYPDETKIAIEINGHEFHTGLENVEKDHERDIELTQLGWRVFYFSGRDIYHDLNKCISLCEELIIPNRKDRLMKHIGREPSLVLKELSILDTREKLEFIVERLKKTRNKRRKANLTKAFKILVYKLMMLES